jgi:hypothetical protein
MSDVIDFIERLGQDSTLRYASRPVLDRVFNEAQVGPELRAALVSRDQQLLESLLGADTNVCCIVEAPLTEEDEDVKPRKADDEKSKDRESVSGQLKLSRVAYDGIDTRSVRVRGPRLIRPASPQSSG